MAEMTIPFARVERVFQTEKGWGVRIAEPFTRLDGTEGHQYFSLMLDYQPNLIRGNTLAASGRPGWKIRRYGAENEKETIDVSLYDVTISEVATGSAGARSERLSDQGWTLPPASRQEAF